MMRFLLARSSSIGANANERFVDAGNIAAVRPNSLALAPSEIAELDKDDSLRTIFFREAHGVGWICAFLLPVARASSVAI
jgi:hypothetical protein